MIAPVVATIACGLATVALVLAEWRGWPRARIAAKLAASSSFLVVGLTVVGRGHTPYATAVLIGLGFGALGDLALLGKSTRAFLGGLGAFLVGHLAYVVGMATLVAPSRWLAAAGPLAVVPLAVGVAVVALLWSRLGSTRLAASMKGPVIAYLVAIVAMVVGALAVWQVHALGATPACLLVVGAVLFFASDIAVARNRFVGDDITNKAWGLPAYFAGQLLIAWSLARPSLS